MTDTGRVSNGDLDVLARQLVRKIAAYKTIDHVNVEEVLSETRRLVTLERGHDHVPRAEAARGTPPRGAGTRGVMTTYHVRKPWPPDGWEVIEIPETKPTVVHRIGYATEIDDKKPPAYVLRCATCEGECPVIGLVEHEEERCGWPRPRASAPRT